MKKQDALQSPSQCEKAMDPRSLIGFHVPKSLAHTLARSGLRTLPDIHAYVVLHGYYWWKKLPAVGETKAALIVSILKNHADTLGALPEEACVRPSENIRHVATISPGYRDGVLHLAPFGHFEIPYDLSGAEGINRAQQTKSNEYDDDAAAIYGYFHKFRDQPKTLRSYQKEIERLVLWCIVERKVAMSSMRISDCEAYKDFILNPPKMWQQTQRASKAASNWKPFAGPLSLKSASYALGVIKSFFRHLCEIRYLEANPWVAVSMPRLTKGEPVIDTEKAIPESLWKKLIGPEGILDTLCATPSDVLASRYKMRGAAAYTDMAAQYRLARVIIMLGGNAGLRREEIAACSRADLTECLDNNVWELSVIGKGNKRRQTYLSDREIHCLRIHWQDRGLDFDNEQSNFTLVAPLVIPQTHTSTTKHFDTEGNLTQKGFSTDSIYQFVVNILNRIAEDMTTDLSAGQRKVLMAVGVHALRHTFGRMAAKKIPIDVLRDVLGHSSIQTTSIYIDTDKDRRRNTMSKFLRHGG